MKYISNLVLGLLTVAATTISCEHHFLDTAPTSATSTATAYSTTETVKMVVNSLAEMMCTQHNDAYSQGCCGENRIRSIYEEYPSQEFRYNFFAPGWDTWMNGTEYTVNNNSYGTYPWSYYYEIVVDANSIIANVDGAEGTEAEKKFYKAQALVFRAYAFTQLAKYYCKAWKNSNNGASEGLVLRLDESTGPMPLSTLEEVYLRIYRDCDDAIQLFTESQMDRAQGEVWLPNLNVAYAVKARAALNREDYGEAINAAKKARAGYDLMSNADYTAGFCEPTDEWLFGSYASTEENNWYWTFGTQFGCNGYYASKAYYGTGDIEKELTDVIPDNDIRKGLFLTVDKFPGYDFTSDTIMDQTYGYFLDDDLWDDADAYIQSITPAGLAKAYQYGYFYLNGQLKFWVFGTPGLSYNCFMRSSEMVLIEAEANYFLGNTTDAQKALEELNQTRQPGYTCTKTGDDLFKEIVNYRELELWGEGFNWYDHKRWNMPITRKSFANGGNCHTATATTIPIDAAHNWWTFEIPEVELDHNDQIKKATE